MRKITFFSILIFALAAETFAEQFSLKVGKDRDVYYFAEHDILQGNKDLKYALIYIHGAGGGAGDSAKRFRIKAKEYKANEKVYCIAPSFFTAKTVKKLRDKALIWEKGWRQGDPAINGCHIGSYEVIDRIYTILSDPKLYPSLKRIVLCGFSAGGQFVNRYIAVGKLPVAPHIETGFAVANPSIYLYINKLRMVNGKFQEVNEKNGFNNWYYGLDNRNAYCKDLSVDDIMKNLAVRKTLYFCGTADIKGLKNPEAMLQGKNRCDRLRIYQQYTAMYPQWAKALKFFYIPNIKHDTAVFYVNNILPKWVLGEEL